RREYLRLAWKAMEPPSAPEYYTYGYYGNWLPVAVARNVARLAVAPEDRARAEYLLALSLRQEGARSALVIEAFEKSLAAAKTAYYDDALFALAQTYENGGRRVRRDGRWEEQPDYAKALALYQRLTKEFKKSESRYWDQAQESAKNITEPQLNVSVGQMFLPGARPSFYLSWRNVADVKFRLEKVDPLTDFAPQPGDSASNWTEGFRKGGKKIRQWEKTLVAPEHAPGNENVTLEEPLPAGTYLLTAESGKLKSTEIVLMTDALVLTRAYPGKVAVFVPDARSGAPLAEASVAYWERQYNSSKSVYEWRRKDGRTNAEGLAFFDVPGAGGRETFVAAKKGDRTAAAYSNAQSADADSAGWRIYVHTDRPAYRPEDTVKWKAIVRRTRGGVYELPGRETIKYRVTDPRGTVLKEGSGALNAFGALWGDVALSAETPLGMYQIQFLTANNDTIGGASLFRLEEYKLPEFKVAVEPA
ncbi:MAG TPA: MG2 domain-containing protein, partial [Elusimicrobiota bacterium]|nr:MG2 domain-containing protein [Elusimicrobiota bacterium]